MTDPIYARYKAEATAEEEARAAERRQKAEDDERERQQLLASIPEAVDRLFERQEATDYADEMVKGILRNVKLPTGEIQETVTWGVGSSDWKKFTYDDDYRDNYVISSDRRFWSSVGAYPRYDAPYVPLDLSRLNLEGLKGVVSGIELVGTRKPRPGTGWED